MIEKTKRKRTPYSLKIIIRQVIAVIVFVMICFSTMFLYVNYPFPSGGEVYNNPFFDDIGDTWSEKELQIGVLMLDYLRLESSTREDVQLFIDNVLLPEVHKNTQCYEQLFDMCRIPSSRMLVDYFYFDVSFFYEDNILTRIRVDYKCDCFQ